jgi:hypothetical protein
MLNERSTSGWREVRQSRWQPDVTYETARGIGRPLVAVGNSQPGLPHQGAGQRLSAGTRGCARNKLTTCATRSPAKAGSTRGRRTPDITA